MSDPVVRHEEPKRRYVIELDGAQVGETVYEPRDGDAVAFMHTEIDKAHGGRGLASTLIKGALDDVRSSGRSVLPYCPFVRGYLEKHPEELDLVPLAARARFGLAAT